LFSVAAAEIASFRAMGATLLNGVGAAMDVDGAIIPTPVPHTCDPMPTGYVAGRHAGPYAGSK
jgi:hypothetical protein